MIDRYPKLIIIPKTESESFEVIIKSGPRDTDLEHIGNMKEVQWGMNGPYPDWTMKHKYVKIKKKERIPGLPSGPTKKQMVLMGAKHFFGEREFSSRELVCILKDTYPASTLKLNPNNVSQLLNWHGKEFTSRRLGKAVVWKCIEPSDENLQSQDVKQPSYCSSIT